MENTGDSLGSTFRCDTQLSTLLPPGIRAEGAGSSGPFTCPVPNIQKTPARPKFSFVSTETLRPNVHCLNG